MKKQFLKSFALVAMLLCGLTASAEGMWCEKRIGHFKADGSDGADVNSYVLLTVMNNGDGTITFTIANDPEKNKKDVDYILINQGYGTAGADVESNAPMSQSVTYTLPDGTTELKGVEILWSNSGDPGRWMVQNVDIKVSDMCTGSGEEKETFKPTMTSASLAEVSHNAAVINVAGTDKETEDGENVAVTRFKVVYGETEKTYTTTEGQITITGLTPGTAYSFTIFAVDAVGNVSEKGLTVEATTENRASQCSGECGHFGTPDVKRIAYTIEYNPVTKAVVYTISALKGKKLDFLEVQTTKGSSRVNIPEGGSTSCTYSQTGVAVGDEIGIRFLYSTDEIGAANEMNAENVTLSDPNIIYYKVGDCEMEEDTEKPMMESADLISNTYNSVVIAVEAKDNKGVVSYNVVDEANSFNANFAAVDGKITVTGLTPNTTYLFYIYAVDARENVSTNYQTVTATTLSYPAAPTAPVHAQDKVRSIYSDTYTSALAHDFAKNSWSGIQYEEIKLDEKNHYLFYTANVNWIAWGESNDGENAIIAADGYNDGTHAGLDLSVMDYLHVDIFVDAECVSGVVFINNDKLAELGTLEGGKWNSFDLSLDGLKSGLTEAKQESKINSTRWIKFDGLNGVSMVIIDNVYAWKNGTSTAVDNAAISAKVSKTIENGQLVIIREGVRYDVTGRAISK